MNVTPDNRKRLRAPFATSMILLCSISVNTFASSPMLQDFGATQYTLDRDSDRNSSKLTAIESEQAEQEQAWTTLAQLVETSEKNIQSASAHDRAIAIHRASIKHSPHRPHPWANLALAKAVAYQIDDEFYLAFEQANKLGVTYPEIRFLLIDAGIAAWDDLDMDQTNQVIELFRISLKNQPKETRDIIQSSAHAPTICSKLPFNMLKKAGCH